MFCLDDDSHDCFDIHVAYITNSASGVVIVNRYIQYRLKGSYGYKISVFHFLYTNPMKISCVYTRVMI